MTLQHKTKNKLFYFIAPLLTVLVLLFVYYQKGVYPFGGDTVFSCDFGQAEFPYYVHVYDVLHGNGSLFYDLTSAGGIEYNIVCRLFDPFMWLLLFVPRAFLGNFMSYFFVIFFFVICCVSQFAIRKIFKELPWYWVSVFSLVYTLSGYNLQYYTNSEWLIIVALFPLVALFCMRMLDGGKVYPFVIVLAFCLIVNTYISALMLGVMLIICSLYIFLMLDKSNSGNAALKLGTGVVCSVGISAFAVIPWLFTTLFSQRFSSTSGTSAGSFLYTYLSAVVSKEPFGANKAMMLFGLEFCIATIFVLILKFRQDKKKVSFFVLSSLCIVFELAFESVNLIMHGGSYQLFPVRNGFIMVFMCICASCYYIEKYDINRDLPYKFKYSRIIVPMVMLLMFLFTVPQYELLKDTASKYSSTIYTSNITISKSVAYIALTAVAVATVSFVVFYFNKSRKVRNALCIILILVILFTGTSTLFCSGDNILPATVDETYVTDSLDLYDTVSSNDIFSRVCNEDVTLSANYPYLVNRSAISNWHHTLSKEQRNAFKQLGFSLIYTRTLDTGGTLFSKGILGVDNTVTKRNLQSDLFTLENTVGEFNYYKNNYSMPFGVLLNSDAPDIKFNSDLFEYQNSIYHSMGYTDNLFKKADSSEVSSSVEFGVDKATLDETKEYVYTYTVNVGDKSELYFQLNDETDIINTFYSFNDCTIQINGEDFIIPNSYDNNNSTFKDENNNDATEKYYTENTLFRAMYNNNILDFGTYENETVSVTFSCKKELDGCFDMYVMNLQKMGDLSSYQSAVSDYSVNTKTNKIDITASTSDEGKLLFIPLYNNTGWACTVNGENREIVTVLDGFMAVELNSGENEITLKYTSRISEYSIIASAVFTVTLLAMWLIFKNKKFNLKIFEKIALFAVALLFSVMIILVYLIPIGYYIYSLFI